MGLTLSCLLDSVLTGRTFQDTRPVLSKVGVCRTSVRKDTRSCHRRGRHSRLKACRPVLGDCPSGSAVQLPHESKASRWNLIMPFSTSRELSAGFRPSLRSTRVSWRFFTHTRETEKTSKLCLTGSQSCLQTMRTCCRILLIFYQTLSSRRPESG